MALNIQIDQQKLAEFCQKWGIASMAIYGTHIRENEGEIIGEVTDVMYTLLEGVRSPSYLGGFFDMEDEISAIMGRTVAMTSRDTVKRNSSHRHFREYVESMKVIYAR